MSGLAALLVGVLGVPGVRAAGTVTFTVTSTVDAPDANPGDGVCASTATGNPCTLRAAIQEADALGSGSTVTIDVPAGGYDLTIPPSGSDGIATGDLNITTSLAVVGAGAGSTLIDGGKLDRVFSVAPGTSVSLTGLTIQDGLVSSSGSNAYGGAIYASGALTLTGDVISGSSASTSAATGQAGGGGIYADAASSLTLLDTTVTGNSTTSSATTESSAPLSEGGGIAFFGSSLVLRASTVSANTAASQLAFTEGGGIYDEGSSLTIGGSTISHNSAQAANATSSNAYGDGGGLYYVPTASAPPAVYITDSTIVDNSVTATDTSSASPAATATGGGMDLETNGDATLSNDVIAGNSVTASAGASAGSLASGNAGGLEASINASSTLTVDDVTVADNTVTAQNPVGGGMESDSSAVHISGSTFTGNAVDSPDVGSLATVEGGALFDNSTTDAIDTSTFTDNQAVSSYGIAYGGAIFSNASETITASTLAGNTASGSGNGAEGSGGAIFFDGNALTITDSTVSGNAAEPFSDGANTGAQGGGLYLAGLGATFDFDTIAANAAAPGQGGGLYGFPPVTVHASVLDNPSGGDCAGGPYTSDGDNIDTDGTCQLTCPCDLTGVDPGLGTLADNGGPTQTQALLPGSPAIDGAGTTDCVPTDQRGVPRPQGPACDIGAFELAPPGVAPPDAGPSGSELWGDSNPAEPGACACATHPAHADPVQTATGNLVETATDLSVPGRGPGLAFTRTYNALDAASATGPDALGYGWTDAYAATLSVDPASGEVTVHQGDGATATFAPTAGGGFTAPAWVVATLVQDSDGSYTFSLPTQLHYRFSPAGQLLSISDRNGYATTLGYTGGVLTSVTDSAGRALSLAYNGAGQLTSVTDPAGRTVTYAYDAAGDLASVTDPTGALTSYGYDRAHELTSITLPTGAVITNSYDSAGRVVAQTDPLGQVTAFSYAPGRTTITDPRGTRTVEDYVQGELISRTLAAGTAQAATWTYGYDGAANLASVTDPDGHTTRYSYDARANLLSATDPLGRTTSYTYDALGDLTSRTDPSGVTTSYTYDDSGNLLSISTPLPDGPPVVTSFSYTDGRPGELTGVTDPDGGTWTIGYDRFGELTSATDPLGDTTSYSYECTAALTAPAPCYPDVGLAYASVSPAGNQPGANPAADTTSYTYDGDGRPLSVTDPDGHTTTATYTAAGQPATVSDPDGHLSTFGYDAAGELTTQVSGANTPAAQTRRYAYDGDANLVSATVYLASGATQTTSYTYDAANRLASMSTPPTGAAPAGITTSYGYDGAGNLLSVASGSGQTTSYTYDAADELTGVHYSDGATPDVAYSYDADGRRVAMTDSTGTSRYTWDEIGRLTSATDGSGQTTSYRYDPAGALTELTYPNGQQISRGYDAAGRLTSLADGLGNTTNFGYDPNGNLTTIAYPAAGGGVTEAYRYDPANQLTAISDTAGTAAGPLVWASYRYTRDPAGALTGATTALPGGATASDAFTYTARDAIASWTSPTAAGSYSYDLAGNLTGLPDGTTQSYDAADELTAKTSGPVTTTFGYDSRGDRTAATVGGLVVASYGYDQADRLTELATPALAAAYAYNGDGLRTAATFLAAGTLTPAATAFVYDLTTSPAPILTDGVHNYLYGPGGLAVEQVDLATGAAVFFGHDQQGSTRELFAATGVVGSYAYSPYGVTLTHTGAATRLQYDGAYHDPTGLYYLHARYYDPATGQFLTRDPLEDVTGAPYSYADDDPVDNTDPSGLFCWGVCSFSNAWNDTGGKVVHYVASHTIGGCVNVNAAFGVGGSAEGCVALVGGKPTVIGSVEGGGGTPGVSVTGGLLISNAHTPSQLRGAFGVGGVSVGEGLVAGDQAAVGSDACGNTIWTNEIDGGLGLYGPLPFQVFGGVSNTWTWSL